MSDNLYQPPKSDVDIPVEVHQPFYVVSIRKFWVLFAATFGIYHVYWFYKHWRQHKNYTGGKLWPVARGVFSIFFAHKLFREVRDAAVKHNQAPPIRADLLATVYVIFAVVSNVAERLSAKDIGSPYSDFISILTLPLVGWVLMQVQRAANAASGDPLGDSNREFTAANIVWIVLGVLFWMLVLVGLFYIATETPA